MNLKIEIEQEEDGRFIAEVIDFPGVLAYGNTRQEAVAKVQALALRVLADKLEDFVSRRDAKAQRKAQKERLLVI